MNDGFNPYELLELKSSFESTENDIKKAYRRLALLKHPDKNPDASPEEFLNIQRAYDVLCDEDAKQALDNLLRARASREARLSAQSLKRRKMREELEHRERESQAQATAEAQLRCKLKMELDRVRAKMNSQAAACRTAQDLHGGKKKKRPESSLCMVKLRWGPHCDLEEKEIRALFAAIGRIKHVVIRNTKWKGSGAILEMSSQEEAQAVVQHVNLHEGLGIDSFSAKLMLESKETEVVQQKETSSNLGSQPKCPDSSRPRIDLQNMEDAILSKLKRKAASRNE